MPAPIAAAKAAPYAVVSITFGRTIEISEMFVDITQQVVRDPPPSTLSSWVSN